MLSFLVLVTFLVTVGIITDKEVIARKIIINYI